MMRSIFIFVLLIIVSSTSCSIPQKDDKIITKNRVIYILEQDSLIRKEDYELTIEIRDTVTIYRYQNLTDQEKDMVFKYSTNSKLLSFSFSEFELNKKNKYSESRVSKMDFDFYKLKEPVMDGNGPMLFNTSYGILNVDNGWGMKFIILEPDVEIEIVNSIIKVLKQ